MDEKNGELNTSTLNMNVRLNGVRSEMSFEGDECMGTFMDNKENLVFEEESYTFFPISSVEDAIEHRVAIMMFLKIDMKRKA